MDDNQVDAVEEEDGKRGVSEVWCEEEEEQEREVSDGVGRRMRGGEIVRTSEMERKESETSFGKSPEGSGGRRPFQEGALVEVRQKEKGLRGSWHPAVVIGLKPGRRVVEYDELLTDDGSRKLTETVRVDTCLVGGRLGTSRQSWKSPPKRNRALLRPRPPPLPDPSTISWSKGLSVDCYFQDAWWEGVLTEEIASSTKKRVKVWFPEEEDWTAMPLNEMRVGQKWDEETDTWSLKGFVDIPIARKTRRPKTMSLSQKPRGFARTGGTNERGGGMELAIALKIDNNTSSSSRKDTDYTDSWNQTHRSNNDADNAMLSVQLNSPRGASFSLRQQAGTERSSGDSSKGGQKYWPLALRTRSSEFFPQPLRVRSPSGRTRGEPSLYAGPSCSEDRDNVASGRNGDAGGDGEDQWGVSDRYRIVTSDETVNKENLDGVEVAILRERARDGADNAENGSVGQDVVDKVAQADITPRITAEQERGVRELIASGWTITRSYRRKDGKTVWHYRSPHGCLLGSLQSALGMNGRLELYDRTCGDEENPTLSDILSPKSSPFGKSRSGSGRMLKSTLRVVSPSSVKEGGQEMDQPEPSNSEHLSNSEPPAGSNGTRKSTITGSPMSPLRSSSAGKRVAYDSSFIVEDGKLYELKRRKVQDLPADQTEMRSSLTSESNGGPLDGSDSSGKNTGVSGRNPGQSPGKSPTKSPEDSPGKSTPLTESKPLSKSVDEGPATETRSKKRACVADGVKREQGYDLFNARRADDGYSEYEPRTKKIRIIAEAMGPSEGKSRKSLAILQESSRKRGLIPFKHSDSKMAKKGSFHEKKSPSQVKKGKKSRTPGRPGVRLEVLLSAPGTKIEGEGGELTRKRTLLSWLIDNGTVSEHEKVRYLHRKDLHCMLAGIVTRDGILCDCCQKIVTLSVFEAHAGSKLHRPSANIFLNDGRSLSVCQVEALAVKTQSEADGLTDLVGEGSLDKSDDTCGICGDGGKLICCDHCPSTFHLTCMGLQDVPDGDWYCPNCRCASCGDSQFNGDKTTFNDLTVIFCDQCECEYHVKCLRERGLTLAAVPQEDFFCGDSCGRIFQGLRSLVGICKPMEGGFSWTLLRSRAEDDRFGSISNSEIDVEHDSKLSIALSVMQECFRPMIDPRTKIDIITHVLYNRRSEVSRLNYHGFYTMLLERGDELISVATIRVHGAKLAELPLIGTRFQYRRQGMCRRLMSAIEEMLLSLGVERLVLPAVPELLDTWTGAFGFQPMDESGRLQLMDLNIMAFPGTSILYKRLDTVVQRPGATFLRTVDQASYAEVSYPRLQKEVSNASLASPPVIVKRRPGRPPKVKGDTASLSNGFALSQPEAAVGGHNLGKSGNTARFSNVEAGSPCVAVKRGRGRPPKNSKALLKPTDGAAELALSTAVVEAHGLAEAGRDAGGACSSAEGFLGKAARVSQLLKDGAHRQDQEPYPTIVRRKRGRPPRARTNYNPSNVAGFNGGRFQSSSAAREQATEAAAAGAAAAHSFLERSSDEKFLSAEAPGDFKYGGGSAIVPRRTPSPEEVTDPPWLVQAHQGEILPLDNFGTRTYERRRGSGLSPLSDGGSSSESEEADGSDGEPLAGRADWFDEDDDGLHPAARRSFCYETVSVPIRTFPSEFASRGDHNNPPGTFIPVETIVVNSDPKGETLDEFLVPPSSSEKRFHPERGEQRSGGKLLLRLKLPKRKMSPGAAAAAAARDLEQQKSQPSSTSSAIKLPNVGLLPPAFTVSEQMSTDVSRFEQFDEEQQLNQAELALGSHCIPVPVS